MVEEAISVTTSVTTATGTSETYSYEACLALYVDDFISYTEQQALSTIVLETLTAEEGEHIARSNILLVDNCDRHY